MLNILRGYIENSLPAEGIWETSQGLLAKVDSQGRMLPFAGNTAVFLLDRETKVNIASLQSRLYHHAGSMLAEPLVPDTFHMTLHDLANGKPEPDTTRWMAQTESAAAVILAEIKSMNTSPLSMKTTWMFNMVNTSIVLGLEPDNKDSWERLSHMYEQLNKVVPLNYALTPHITLAYYKPGCYTQQDLEPLRRQLSAVDLPIQLRMENLVLQTFSDMNHYRTIG